MSPAADSRDAGQWVWFELMTDDPDGAQAFYGNVLGWTATPGGAPGTDYRYFRTGDREAGGLLRMSPMPRGPVWVGYLGVDDVDATAGAIPAAGGSMHMPPTNLPGVGRLAMFTDPQGAAFYVISGERSPAGALGQQCGSPSDDTTIGQAVWCELAARDPDAALGFYRRIFGWRSDGGMPMGDLGEYRFLSAGDTTFGGLTPLVPGGGKGWVFYFQVPDIGSAARRVAQSGGRVILGPEEIPGGMQSLLALDPRGASFGLVGPGSGVPG